MSPINGNGVELTLLKEERLIFPFKTKIVYNRKSFQFEIQSWQPTKLIEIVVVSQDCKFL